MERLQDKLTNLINNGYGINQAMEKLSIKKNDVITLMQENNDIYKKLQKRFKGTEWIDKVEYKGKTVELPNSDTPELTALKAEAQELGIEFNPRIGFDTLKKRVDEWKATHAAEDTPLEQPEE